MPGKGEKERLNAWHWEKGTDAREMEGMETYGAWPRKHRGISV